jgi:hypothetical protein
MVAPDAAGREAQALTNQETAMPALLLALAVMIRRRLPSIWSVLLVLAVLTAAAVVVLHSITAWITGHPLAVALLIGAGAAAAGVRRAR